MTNNNGEMTWAELLDRLYGYPLFSRDSSEAERRDCNSEGLGRKSQVPAPAKMLSGHQPVYLPSILLMNKIALSDIFMFVGHCQFVAGSWQQRNRIRQGDDAIRLTVPVKGEFGDPINKMQLGNNGWRRKHLASIRYAYGHRPFFDLYYPAFVALLNSSYSSLAELNQTLIVRFLEWLQIKTPIFYSDDYAIAGNKTDMLISMCLTIGATEYLSNEGARAYVDEYRMSLNGITHHWQKFRHPIYDQGHREFVTDLSIIDLLFNCGPDSGRIVREAGHVD